MYGAQTLQKVGDVIGDPPPSLKGAFVKLQTGIEVRPLELLMTPTNSETWSILRVSNIYYRNPYQSADSLDVAEKSGVPSIPFRGGEATYLPGVYQAVETDLVDCFMVRDGRLRPIGRTRSPIPGNPVYRANEYVVEAIVGRPVHRLRLGYLSGTRGVDFVLDANTLMRHCLIVGNPGTGKSYFRGVLMEELFDIRARQVNFDPLDEYSNAVSDLGGVNLLIGRDYRPRLDYLSEFEFTSLIEAAIPTEFQRAIAREGFIRFVEESRRREQQGGTPLDPQELIDYVWAAAHAMRAGEETRTNVIERLKTFLNSLSVLGVGGIDLARTIEENRLVNFVFRDVTETQITFSVASILKEIMNLRGNNRIGTLLVSTDEAHLLVPSGKSNPPSKGVIKRLMRYGRHFGIGVMLITQLPASLDPEVVNLPSVRVFFATSTDQVKGISYLLSDLPRMVLEDIPRLERGTCIITGAKDLIRHSAYVRIRSDRRTRHGAPTPPLVS